MSIQAQVLDALRSMAGETNPYAAVTVGALPPQNGLCLAVSAGRAGVRTLSGGGCVTLDVTLNAKHENQRTAMDALCTIHEALTRRADLPCGEGWQMIAVRTAAAPSYLDREGGQWLYGSALSVEYAED